MGNLLANATAVGFGAQVAITSKDATFNVTGLADGWFITVYFSATDVSSDFVPIVEPQGKPPKNLVIKNNGPQNFSFLATQGNVRGFLEGGRTTVSVNMDILFAA